MMGNAKKVMVFLLVFTVIGLASGCKEQEAVYPVIPRSEVVAEAEASPLYIATISLDEKEKSIVEGYPYFIFRFNTLDAIDRLHKVAFCPWSATQDNRGFDILFLSGQDGKTSFTGMQEYLNLLAPKTSEDKPLYLVGNTKQLYGVIGENAYCVNDVIVYEEEAIGEFNASEYEIEVICVPPGDENEKK